MLNHLDLHYGIAYFECFYFSKIFNNEDHGSCIIFPNGDGIRCGIISNDGAPGGVF